MKSAKAPKIRGREETTLSEVHNLIFFQLQRLKNKYKKEHDRSNKKN